MGHQETDLSQIVVPPEDEAIPRAFAQLESNIGAWSSAVSDAQRMLAQLIEQARVQQAAADLACAKAKEAQTAVQSTEVQEQAKKATKTESADTAPKAQSAPAVKAPAKPAEPQSAPKAPPKYTREMAQSDTDEANKKRGKGLTGRRKRKNAADEDANAAANEAFIAKSKAGEKSKSDDPEEALLATLDEKTAQAIRIKRRLLNKSVRELLDEMK